MVSNFIFNFHNASILDKDTFNNFSTNLRYLSCYCTNEILESNVGKEGFMNENNQIQMEGE